MVRRGGGGSVQQKKAPPSKKKIEKTENRENFHQVQKKATRDGRKRDGRFRVNRFFSTNYRPRHRCGG